MDARHRPKTSQRKTQTTRHRGSQRKTGNVRVLYPSTKTRTKVNYGRVVMLGLVMYFVIWTVYPITARIEQGSELKKLKGQLGGIEKQNNKLKKDVEYLNSDEYVEQKARSLGLSKPDEEVVVIIPPDAEKPLKHEESNAEKKEQSKPANTLWDRIVGIFSSIF